MKSELQQLAAAREKQATNQLRENGYLDVLESVRDTPAYQELVKKLRKELEEKGVSTECLATISENGYEAEIFAKVKIDYSEFLMQTLSYDPPEEDVKSVMHIALISGNVLDKVKKYGEQLNSTYLVAEAIDLN